MEMRDKISKGTEGKLTVTRVGVSDKLPANGTVEQGGGFKFKFENLPSDYTYSITEQTVEGYKAPEITAATDSTPAVIKNTEFAFPFSKVWNNTDGKHTWPTTVTSLTFIVTGTKTVDNTTDTRTYTVTVNPTAEKPVSVTLDDAAAEGVSGELTPVQDTEGNVTSYTVTMKGLSSEYTYVVAENEKSVPTGYKMTKEGTTVTNTQLKSFKFTKAWANADGTPDWKKDIKVTLAGTKKDDNTKISAIYTISKDTDGHFTVTKEGDEAGLLPADDKVITPTGDTYTFKFDNLPAEYEYTLTEEVVPGYQVPEYKGSDGSKLEDQSKGITTGGTITNTETTFQFTKEWQNESGFTAPWLDNQTLEFKIADEANAEYGVKVEYGADKQFTVTVTKPTGDAYKDLTLSGKVENIGNGENDPKYQITIIGLPAGHSYKVTEETQVEGYDAPKYGENGETYVEAGGTITNKKTSTYSLPATGGPGPIRYIGGGLLLMLLALLLIYKNTHERRKCLS